MYIFILSLLCVVGNSIKPNRNSRQILSNREIFRPEQCEAQREKPVACVSGVADVATK